MTTLRTPLVTLALALAATTGCAKTDKPVDTTSATTATPAPAPAPFEVGDIDMGRHVGPDKKISDKTDDFGVRDTIFASIHTKGGTAPAQVMARWTFQDGKVVHEETQSVSGGVEGDTEFHITKATAWPKGKYTVHILVDGTEAKTKDVTVK
jgi:ABC-type amino acid transport substrate-binding protein